MADLVKRDGSSFGLNNSLSNWPLGIRFLFLHSARSITLLMNRTWTRKEVSGVSQMTWRREKRMGFSRRLGIEQLEARSMLSATVFAHNNINYFLQQSEPAIERYDIVNEQWLEPIALAGFQGTPTVAYADDEGIYVSFYDGDGSLHRFDLDGSNHRHIATWNRPVHELYSDGDILFVNQSSSSYIRFISFDKTTWQFIDVYDRSVASAFRGASISREQNRIVGRSSTLR